MSGRNHEGGRAAPLAEERRRLIADLVLRQGSVSIAELESEFGISAMTARRDLGQLERSGIVKRTHGGAVLPGVAGHEDSFAQRVVSGTPEKQALARAYVARLSPGESLFLDSSTTAYFVGSLIIEQQSAITMLTNSVALMTLVAERAAPNVELIGLGGALREVSRSLVGPATVAGIRAHVTDRAVISVKGITDDGRMMDPDPLEAEVKREMLHSSREPALLIDASKFDAAGLHVIGDVGAVHSVFVAGAARAHVDALRRRGLEVVEVAAA
jgi:DeoR/GlpR family transcriptional regulator of sugar metabolism